MLSMTPEECAKMAEAIGRQLSEDEFQRHWLPHRVGEEIAKRIRKRLEPDPGQTHWDGCWKEGPRHYHCAVERLKELEVRLGLD
jgi:hypothetical protein